MKGIRKLFFGLILMTLIGVGFKVDAKATPANPTIILENVTSGSWNASDVGIRGSVTLTSDDFPTLDAADKTYKCQVLGGTATDNYEFVGDTIIILRNTTAGGYQIKVDGYDNWKSYTPGTDIFYFPVQADADSTTGYAGTLVYKDTIRSILKEKFSSSETIDQNAFARIVDTSTDPDDNRDSTTTINIKLGQVKTDSGAYCGTNKFMDIVVDDGSTNPPALPVYLFPGEELKLKTKSTVDTNVYTWSNWTIEPTTAGSINTGTKDSNTFTMATTPVAVTVKDNFSAVDITFNGVVFVNENLSINLNKFTSAAGSTTAMTNGVTRSNTAINHITINPTTAGNFSNVKVTGTLGTDATASTGVPQINITNLSGNVTTGNVTVYPEPTLESTSSKLTITMPYGVYYDSGWKPKLTQTVLRFSGSDGSEDTDPISITSSDSYKLYNTKEVSLKQSSSSSNSDDINLTSILKEVCSGSSDTVTIRAYAYYDSKKDSNIVSNDVSLKAYKINLEGNASYKVDGQDVSGHFYALKGSSHTITISGTGTLDKNNTSSEFANSTSYTLSGVSESKTLKANYVTSTSSSAPSSSSTPRNAATAGEGMDDYDDVPKTGESKADIWILWSVLFVSILGAGFMIWKRFGLVRAIAEADEEVAVAEHKEEVKAKKKEKEDKIKMLKDLRNL